MRHPSRLLLTALVLAAIAGSGGCRMFGKKTDLYAQSPESRPLEVPPDLDRPAAANAMQIPAAGASASASGLAQARATTANVGFTIPGTRDSVFARVGQLLAATSGLTITGTAQGLGIYDVSYEGSSFLVRIADGQGGSYVSAIDSRGQPAAGAPATKLIDALKAAVAP